jgi:acyl-CoA thioesterase-1
MPRRLLVTLAALATTLAGSAVLAAPIRVAVIGAQMVHSDKLQRAQEWPRMLGDALGAGYDVQNFGDCCSSVLLDYPKQRETHPYLRPFDDPFFKPGFHESVAFMPSVVIIGPWGKHDWELSDLLYKGMLPADRYQADFDTMVKTYLDLPTRPRVFVSLPIPLPKGTPQPGVIDRILAATRAVAEKYQLPVIDLYQPFLGHPELFKDITHVTDSAGLHKIAEVVQATFTAAVAADAGAPIAVVDGAAAAPDSSAPSPPPAVDAATSGPPVDAATVTAPDAPATAAPRRSGCSLGGQPASGAPLSLLLLLALARRRSHTTPAR